MQTETVDVTPSDIDVLPTSGGERALIAADVPDVAVVGVTWDADATAEVSVRMRTREGGTWTGWTEVDVNDPTEAGDRQGSEPIAVLGATDVEVEVRAAAGELPNAARLHVIDPGHRPAHAARATDVALAADAAPVHGAARSSSEPSPGTSGGSLAAPTTAAVPLPMGVPTMLSRAQWGADESLRGWRPQLGEMTGAVIHHTAGRNDYHPEEVPAIIRGIYRYHAVDLGRGDIGYNALVDRFGRIWEGRFGGPAHPVIGAHAAGVNATMLGIAVMGDFSTEPVPDAAIGSVAQMTAWMFAARGIAPQGSAVGAGGAALPNRVVGHRDVGATNCPGDAFYARLPELRAMIASIYPSMPVVRQSRPYQVRLAGADRHATSAATSQWMFGRTSVVYVATGFDYADALAGTPAAALTTSPVLLVQRDQVPTTTAAEIRRLRPTTIRALGGSAAISPEVLAQLKELAPSVEVISGQDRYQTAAMVSALAWPDRVTKVYLASGQSAPDALGAAAAAGKEGVPLILVKGADLPADSATELLRLAPDEVVIVGGNSVVGSSAQAAVAALLPTARITRVGGKDRYDTSARLAGALYDRSTQVFHATGTTWPDALSASSAAVRANAPVLLLKPACAPAPIRTLLTRLAPTTEFVIGGPVALADDASRRAC